MLQLIYISSPAGVVDTAEVLRISRHNNLRDDVTGLLYADDKRFLQVLEGPEDKIEAAYERIARDPRHRAAVVLSRRTVAGREFGAWQMAERRAGEGGDIFIARVDALLKNASPNARATFDGLVRLRNAA